MIDGSCIDYRNPINKVYAAFFASDECFSVFPDELGINVLLLENSKSIFASFRKVYRMTVKKSVCCSVGTPSTVRRSCSALLSKERLRRQQRTQIVTVLQETYKSFQPDRPL